MKIIIAEDEPRALKGMKNIITSISEHYDVIGQATDGRQALELITAMKPDVVITDIKMPFMDGIDLIKAVRKYRTDIRFVIISAFAEFDYAQKAIQMGVKEYLLKPLTYDDMVRVMKQLENDLAGITAHMDRQTIAERYPGLHHTVLRAIGMVEDGYASKISQEIIAESLGMTQEYFSYLFHKETGEKFTDFIRKYRMEIAKKLLMDQNMKIQDISYAVGYTDAKYFSKIFRKVTGMTPGEYSKTVVTFLE